MMEQFIPQLDDQKTSLIHSDQGWHYRQPAFKQQLAQANIEQSMSRKGNCYDNAVIESFFATLKKECLYPKRHLSEKQLLQTLHDYIRYYNTERVILKLKMSPVQYRTHFMENCTQ